MMIVMVQLSSNRARLLIRLMRVKKACNSAVTVDVIVKKEREERCLGLL